MSITSPDLAYGINAVTFLVSALLIVRIPAHLLQAVAAVGRGYWRDLADGFALIRNSRALLTVLAAWNVVMLATAGENVAEVVLAKDAFSAGDFGYGLLVGTTGVGLAVGSLLAGSFLENRPLRRCTAARSGWSASASSSLRRRRTSGSRPSASCSSASGTGSRSSATRC